MNESELSVNPQHEWDGTFFHSVNSLATEQELAFLLAGLEGTGWLARAPLDLILLELGKLISYWTLKCWKEKLSIHETEEEDDETLTPDPIHSWSSTCKCLKEGRLNSLWMRVNYWTWKCWKERRNETQHESELEGKTQDSFYLYPIETGKTKKESMRVNWKERLSIHSIFYLFWGLKSLSLPYLFD